MLGYVVRDSVIGKFELIDYAVALSPSGEIRGVEILTYRESHGYEVRGKPWRAQFTGKTASAPLRIGVRIDPRTSLVLDAAASLYRDSAGALDCTRHAGRNAGSQWISCDGIVCKTGPCTLDLGGIAKGYAVDCAIEAMRGFDIDHALVNAGGDMQHFGATALGIAVRDPAAPASLALCCQLFNEALASSSAAGLSAIAPERSRIAGHLNEISLRAGANVLAPTCMLADALTKVVLATGAPAHPLLARYGARALLYRDGLPDGQHLAG